MNSKATFLLGLIAGFVCSFSIVTFRYLSLLPPGTLSESKQKLACTILHCDKPGRLAGTERTLIALALELSNNPQPGRANHLENPTEFHDPQFWHKLETEKKSEIEAIAKDVLISQEKQYQKISKDFLLLQMISTGIDQKVRAFPGGDAVREGEDKVLALGLEFASKTKSVLTPLPVPAPQPKGN